MLHSGRGDASKLHLPCLPVKKTLFSLWIGHYPPEEVPLFISLAVGFRPPKVRLWR